jgi:hypothetical protein
VQRLVRPSLVEALRAGACSLIQGVQSACEIPDPRSYFIVSTGERKKSLSRYDTALPVGNAYASRNCDGIAESQLIEASMKLNCLIPMGLTFMTARKLDYCNNTMMAV